MNQGSVADTFAAIVMIYIVDPITAIGTNESWQDFNGKDLYC